MSPSPSWEEFYFLKGSWPQDAVFDALGKVKLKLSDDVTGPPFSELECICFGNSGKSKSTLIMYLTRL